MPSTDIFAVCCPFRKARVGFPVPGTVHISDDNDDDNTALPTYGGLPVVSFTLIKTNGAGGGRKKLERGKS